MGKLLAPEHRDQSIELDYRFHGVLIRASGNAALKDHLSMCLKRIAPVRRASMEMVHYMQHAHAEHGEIIKAITDGDAAAERIMSEHVALRAEQAKDLTARWKMRHTAALEANA